MPLGVLSVRACPDPRKGRGHTRKVDRINLSISAHGTAFRIISNSDDENYLLFAFTTRR